MDQNVETIETPDFFGRYNVARFVAQLISAIGWLTILVGVGFAVLIFRNSGSVGWVALIPAASAAFGGVFLVALGQITRATVDTADYNAQLLELQFYLAVNQQRSTDIEAS